VVDSDYPVSERANPKFMARLRRSGIPVLYTRSTGAITFEWQSGKWRLQTASGTKMDSETLPPRRMFLPLKKEAPDQSENE
jgi:hypothetical protein